MLLEWRAAAIRSLIWIKSALAPGQTERDAGPMTIADITRTAFSPQVRAWRGEAPLWETFWVQGVGVSALLALSLGAALLEGLWPLGQALLLALVAYTGWVVVAIWRCAEQSLNSVWAVMAQAISIAWALNTLFLSGFLAIALR